MSTDRDTTRLVRSWLEEGATALPDRVLDTVLDQVPATPQRRSWWPARRLRNMNIYAKLALAAAAVVVALLLGANLLPRSPSVGSPSPTPAVSPTPSSTPSPSAAPTPVLFPDRPTPGGQPYDPAICRPRRSVPGAGWLHGSGRRGRLDPHHGHRSGWLVRARNLCPSNRRAIHATRRSGIALHARRLVVPPSSLCGDRRPPRRSDHPDRHERRIDS